MLSEPRSEAWVCIALSSHAVRDVSVIRLAEFRLGVVVCSVAVLDRPGFHVQADRFGGFFDVGGDARYRLSDE